MKNTTKIQLYIVQPNDSVATIINKFKIDEFELRRLNPVLKYSMPHAGQPLNIPVQERDSNEETEPNESCLLTFYKYFVIQKQVIVTYIYIPEYSKVLQDELTNITKDVVKCVEENLEISSQYNLDTILLELENEMLTFVDVIRTKDPKELKKYNDHLNDLLNNFIQLSLTGNKKIDETNIYDIVKKWQMFTLKILAKKYREAEDIFNQLEELHVGVGKSII